MLENLSNSFDTILNKVRGYGRISEANIEETCQLIKDTLIDADVGLAVVEDFVAKVKAESIGKKVISSLRPSESFIAIVNTELINLMGTDAVGIAKPANDPVVVLLCGLQGSGKTTTAAKLANLIKNKLKKRVLVASVDIYRPAAIEQLKILCDENQLDFHQPEKKAEQQDVLQRAKLAVSTATQTLCDYVLIDTAGRNVIDDEMMAEINSLAKTTKPKESLLVIDASLGQEAITVAKSFQEHVDLTGICLTKLDGDARGGAAMSARAVLGVPIKYVGVGEKVADIQNFDPKRMASRILGMGDVVSLVEEATSAMGAKKLKKLEQKLLKKKKNNFTLNDFIDQIKQAQDMGGINKVAESLPTNMANKIKNANINPQLYVHMEAAYNSMTRFERNNPQLINGSRKSRIAKGAGVEVNTVNQLLSHHAQTKKLLKRFSKNPMAAMGMMRGFMR